jgi:hypothetical protein
MRTADGYIRVSRVGGRGGESFISPDEQRAAIEAWARSTGTTILEWHTDLDRSGGTLDREGFQAALERCRAGLAGGIVAAKIDRLARSTVARAVYCSTACRKRAWRRSQVKDENGRRLLADDAYPNGARRGRVPLGTPTRAERVAALVSARPR